MTVPERWLNTTVGDVFDVVTGKTPPTKEPRCFGGSYPFAKPGDLDAPDSLVTTETSLTEAAFEYVPRLPVGTVLVSCIGNLGKTALLAREGSCNQQLNAILPSLAATPEFLRLWAKTLRHWLEENSSATTVSIINKGRFLAAPISLPPLSEQLRIVARVEELTARSRRAKEALDAVPPLLDQLRQSILAAAFRGDLTADWRAKNPNVEPAEKLLARIRAERRERWEALERAKMAAKGQWPSDEESKARFKEPEAGEMVGLSELPKGWCWATVRAVGDADLGRMRSPDKHSGNNMRPYLRVMNVHEDRIDVSDVMEMQFEPDEFEAYRLVPGDILLNEGQSKELIGRPAMFRGELPNVAFTNSLIRFRPYGKAPPGYALALFRYYMRSGRFQQIAQITTNIAHLGANRFRELEFPVAPLEEQKVIATTVRAMLARVDVLQKASDSTSNRCSALDAAILAKAFRGGLVPQDPNDEPAWVLLDRIRAARDSAASIARGSRSRTRRTNDPKPAFPTGDSEDDEDRGSGTDGRPTPENDRAHVSARAADRRLPRQAAPTAPAELSALEPETLHDEIFSALWMHGPLEKEEAVRRVAEHLREAGSVEFQRLRADGALYGQVLDAIESAAKEGRLDRPKRGRVRACKSQATTYTADDWRQALLASLAPNPVDRDEAIRAAADWARDNLGLDFTRLRGDGHIVEGLRSAINSAIRRGEVIRHDASRISRAATLVSP